MWNAILEHNVVDDIGVLVENMKIPPVCPGIFVFYWVYLRIPIYFPNNFCSFFKIVGEYSYIRSSYPIGFNSQTCNWGMF